MDTPSAQAEFERNFNLLHRQVADEKFHIALGLSGSFDSIARERFLPDVV